MPITIQETANRLRSEFAAAERHFDAFLKQIDSIRSTVLTARGELDVPPHALQETLLRLHRATGQAQAAQNDVFRAHDAAAREGKVLMGPEEEYTPSSGIDRIAVEMGAEAASEKPLRLVA